MIKKVLIYTGIMTATYFIIVGVIFAVGIAKGAF